MSAEILYEFLFLMRSVQIDKIFYSRMRVFGLYTVTEEGDVWAPSCHGGSSFTDVTNMIFLIDDKRKTDRGTHTRKAFLHKSLSRPPVFISCRSGCEKSSEASQP